VCSRRFREAELKHGRVAMLACAGMITADKFHPLFGGKLSSNPLLAITQVPKLGLLQILLFIGFMEVFGILNSRRPDYEPGNFLGTSQWETTPTWDAYQLREVTPPTHTFRPYPLTAGVGVRGSPRRREAVPSRRVPSLPLPPRPQTQTHTHTARRCPAAQQRPARHVWRHRHAHARVHHRQGTARAARRRQRRHRLLRRGCVRQHLQG